MVGLDFLGEVNDGRYIRARYSYRAYEFTIERKGRTWWCHGGILIPIREHQWYQHEDQIFEAWTLSEATAYASFSRNSILRKLQRTVDQAIRGTLAREQLETTLP